MYPRLPKILCVALFVFSWASCRSSENSKGSKSAEAPSIVEKDSATETPDGAPSADSDRGKVEDTRNVEFADDQKNDDDDFVIAETSTYISGANLVENRYIAKELGGKNREIPVEFDSITKKFNAVIPKDGYFFVKVGEKAALVPPSNAPIKLTFRSYHLQTEKLLSIALEIGIADLLNSRTLDIGSFSYLGQVLYRTSRRIPDLFNLEKNNIRLVVTALIDSNRAMTKNADVVSLAKSLETEIENNFAQQISARKETSSNRAIAGVFASTSSHPPIKVLLENIGSISENSSSMRNVANEVNYLTAMTKIEKIETLPEQVVEDLSINAWRQVSEYDPADVEILTKTESLSPNLTSLVTETNQAAGEKEMIVDAVFKQRKWRLSESFKNDDLSVPGGRLLRSENQMLFTFFGRPRGTPISSTHPVVNLYTRTYKNGFWYPRKEIAKDLAVGNFILDQLCTPKACFIATFVGEGQLNPPVNGNFYSNYYLQMFILKPNGDVVKANKIENFQFGLIKSEKDDSMDIAILQDRVVTIYSMDINGNIAPKTTYEGSDFTNLYTVNFDNNSILSLQKRLFLTSEAFPNGYWIWKNYFQIDGGQLTEIVSGLQFGSVTGFDITRDSLTVSVVAATKPVDQDRFTARIIVYDIANSASPVPMFNSMSTKVSHKVGSSAVGPGDFAACRLEEDYWFLYASVFSVQDSKNYLSGYSERLPASSISPKILDNGTYARNAVLDCSYQQALYWLSDTGGSQAIKAMNISDSGQFSNPETVVLRTENDRKILVMTTLSDKSGFRAIMGVDAENIFVNSSSLSGLDYSRASMFMHLFE